MALSSLAIFVVALNRELNAIVSKIERPKGRL